MVSEFTLQQYDGAGVWKLEILKKASTIKVEYFKISKAKPSKFYEQLLLILKW